MTATSRACQVCAAHTYTVPIPALSALVCLTHERAYLTWAHDNPTRPASEWPMWRPVRSAA